MTRRWTGNCSSADKIMIHDEILCCLLTLHGTYIQYAETVEEII